MRPAVTAEQCRQSLLQKDCCDLFKACVVESDEEGYLIVKVTKDDYAPLIYQHLPFLKDPKFTDLQTTNDGYVYLIGYSYIDGKKTGLIAKFSCSLGYIRSVSVDNPYQNEFRVMGINEEDKYIICAGPMTIDKENDSSVYITFDLDLNIINTYRFNKKW